LIGRILIGPDPTFSVPEILFPLTHTFSFQEGLAFVILGALCGVASWAFIRLLVVMEDNYPRLPGNAYTQNVVGMAVIGLMMIGLTRVFGHGKVRVVWANTFRGALLRKRKRGSLPSPSDPRLVTPALLPGDGRGMMGGPDLRNRGEGDDQSQHDAGRQRMVQGGKAEGPMARPPPPGPRPASPTPPTRRIARARRSPSRRSRLRRPMRFSPP
jgi:Voltage gated chloride channel